MKANLFYKYVDKWIYVGRIIHIAKEFMTQENRPGRKRLHVDLPEELHKELKYMAIRHNCTATKIIMKLIVQQLKLERKETDLINIR